MVRTSLYEHVVENPPVWERFSEQWDQVALSSRVRIARNLSGWSFPERASADDLLSIGALLLKVADGLAVFADRLTLRMTDLTAAERDLLVERRLISPDLGRGGPGRALAADHTHHLSLMINEEDHVRLQVIVPGFNPERAADLATHVERRLGRDVTFAFDPTLGFLTACPSNVGTGFRPSVMLHLPALALLGYLEPAAKGLDAAGFSIRGAFGEGTDGTADLYQVSNNSSLGETEDDIIRRARRVVSDVVRQEVQARLKLVREERCHLCDHVGRAYGILRYARRLTTEEALNGLSSLAVGIRFGLIRRVSMDTINNLFLSVQPGHMQGRAGQDMASDERDVERAERIRMALEDKTD